MASFPPRPPTKPSRRQRENSGRNIASPQRSSPCLKLLSKQDYEDAPNPLFVLQAEDGVVLQWNKALVALSNIQKVDVIGKPLTYYDVAKNPKQISFRSPTGSTILANLSNGPTEVIGACKIVEGPLLRFLDVNDDQKESAKQLEDTLDQLWGFLDKLSEAVVVADTGMTIKVINPAAVELFGYEKNEVIGRSVEMLMPAKMRGSCNGRVKNYDPKKPKIIGSAGRQVVALHKNGTEFNVSICLTQSFFLGEKLFTATFKTADVQKESVKQPEDSDVDQVTRSLEYLGKDGAQTKALEESVGRTLEKS